MHSSYVPKYKKSRVCLVRVLVQIFSQDAQFSYVAVANCDCQSTLL